MQLKHLNPVIPSFVKAPFGFAVGWGLFQKTKRLMKQAP